MFERALYIVLVIVALRGTTGMDSPNNDRDPNEFDFEESFALLPITKTVNEKFTNLQNGSFQFFLTADCLKIITEQSPFGMDGSCWAQNPDAPYGLIMLPTHVGEVADSYTGYPVTDKEDRSATWHLLSRDVVILLGHTPPECKYFSFTNYLYSRFSPPDFVPDPTLNPIDGRGCLPGAENERCEYFASISDTVNMDRGLNLPEGELKFNASFALILSPSDTATELATRALLEAKVPLQRISNFTFPGSDLNLGDESSADTFLTIMRTAFYSNEDDKHKFFSEIPFKVLRLELKNNTEENIIHAKAPYIPRATGIRNDGTAAGLTIDEMREAVQSLSLHVLNKLIGEADGEPVEVAVSALESGEVDMGDECVARGQRCLADCRDTLYPFSINEYDRSAICESFVANARLARVYPRLNKVVDDIVCSSAGRGLLTNSEDDTMIVVGVNHHVANMSAYSSLAVYDLNTLWGVAAVGSSALNGTAVAYTNKQSLENDPNLALALPYLYAYKIMRQCADKDGEGCLSVPFEASPQNKNIFIPLTSAVGFAERMYDNPISHVGPSVDEIVMPILIHVKKR